MSPALVAYVSRAYRQLLDEATRALEKESIPTAIVFAHAALDLCLEWVISKLLAKRNVEDLAGPILKMSDRVGNRLRLYTALSGDEIKWPTFEKHRERRNALVHRGELCSKADAKESVEYLGKLIDRLQRGLDKKENK